MKRIGIFLASLLWILAALPAHSRTLSVEKWGSDSPYCGAADNPCATINQAIDNADPGNTIRVGPGIYGDINGDGDFNDPGEESRQCGYANSVVCVDRDNLRLESTTGAASTVINGNSTALAGVCLLGKGVTFGKKRGALPFATPLTGLSWTVTASRCSTSGQRPTAVPGFSSISRPAPEGDTTSWWAIRLSGVTSGFISTGSGLFRW